MYKFLIPLFALALLIGCTPSTTTENDAYSTSSASDSAMMPDQSSTSTMQDSSSDTPAGFDGQLISGKHDVTLKTSEGDIVVEIDADAAPKAATNFYVLSKMGFYNGLTFHRVIPGFMIQGGDPNGNGTGGGSIFGETFEDEPNDLQMVRGMIAMANRGPNTNGSQFFIITAEATPWLQGRHTLFGKVIQGMDVVDKISNVQRDSNDMPTSPVTFDAEVKELSGLVCGLRRY
jgi:cyclophilin family peptidyl-prolyl cis-trans isomerase